MSTCSERADLLAAALAYAGRGWTIIPIVGKVPPARMPWKKYQTSRPDELALHQLFARPGITGLAVLLGSASCDVVCRDFDSMDAYTRWAQSHEELARTLPTVATDRGRHVYFRGPALFRDFGDGEYRGDAEHYCLLPPSRHPRGSIYHWLIRLPSGALPTIDPSQAGLFRPWHETERTEQTEKDGVNGEDRVNREGRSGQSRQKKTEAMRCVSGGDDADLQSAIAATLPVRPGQRNRRLFDLARRLKAIPALASAKPSVLRPVLVAWHQQALPAIETKEFTETWADFLAAWQRVRYAAGQGTIEAAFQRAAGTAPPATAVQLYPDSPPIVLLASLCRELQRLAGNADFFLDVRTAGRLLGVPHTTAWRWLTVLCADEILTAGEKGSQAKHRASRFRFVAD